MADGTVFIDSDFVSPADAKMSIFDMNFTLPPVVEMTEVMKDMPSGTDTTPATAHGYGCLFFYC